MGWFSSFCSSVGSAISSAARTIGSGIKAVASKAIDVASKAVSWMADKAEAFVGTVKKVWDVAKPYIKAALPVLEKLAEVSPWPWLATGIRVVRKGLEYLATIEDKAWFQKAQKALEWAMEAAKKFRKMRLNEKEIEEAEERQENLEELIEQMQTEEQRQSIYFAQLINNYALTQTRINKIFDNNTIKDFEHYLRLRATQKLLKEAESKLETAKNIEEISKDDLFLLEVAADLLAEIPTLSDENAVRLDHIIQRRTGKKLIPFVFEEMIFAWSARLESMEAKWERIRNEVASLKRQQQELKTRSSIEDLTPEEEVQLGTLSGQVLSRVQEMKQQEEENRAMNNYINAAEGFLQTLEKDVSHWEESGQEWVLEEVSEVGMIIIDCAQNNKAWYELTDEQQSLIQDYANIFAEDARKRKQEFEQLVEVA